MDNGTSKAPRFDAIQAAYPVEHAPHGFSWEQAWSCRDGRRLGRAGRASLAPRVHAPGTMPRRFQLLILTLLQLLGLQVHMMQQSELRAYMRLDRKDLGWDFSDCMYLLKKDLGRLDAFRPSRMPSTTTENRPAQPRRPSPLPHVLNKHLLPVLLHRPAHRPGPKRHRLQHERLALEHHRAELPWHAPLRRVPLHRPQLLQTLRPRRPSPRDGLCIDSVRVRDFERACRGAAVHRAREGAQAQDEHVRVDVIVRLREADRVDPGVHERVRVEADPSFEQRVERLEGDAVGEPGWRGGEGVGRGGAVCGEAGRGEDVVLALRFMVLRGLLSVKRAGFGEDAGLPSSLLTGTRASSIWLTAWYTVRFMVIAARRTEAYLTSGASLKLLLLFVDKAILALAMSRRRERESTARSEQRTFLLPIFETFAGGGSE
ncbi:hypothetical protein EIP86_000705 [Pleurotus ostreatoroseus]|nr:hypothetical protein EIP86_000705 [Pleurotus ostreatoroseus]